MDATVLCLLTSGMLEVLRNREGVERKLKISRCRMGGLVVFRRRNGNWKCDGRVVRIAMERRELKGEVGALGVTRPRSCEVTGRGKAVPSGGHWRDGLEEHPRSFAVRFGI